MAPGSSPSDCDISIIRLRLYVARSTPNSVRAESNLAAALQDLDDERARAMLEIVDVFAQAKRAMTDGVIVTPTLIGTRHDKRVVLMGDLADGNRLRSVLRDLFA